MGVKVFVAVKVRVGVVEGVGVLVLVVVGVMEAVGDKVVVLVGTRVGKFVTIKWAGSCAVQDVISRINKIKTNLVFMFRHCNGFSESVRDDLQQFLLDGFVKFIGKSKRVYNSEMESFKNIPQPANKRIALRVNAAAERSVRQGHPWLFENSITHQSHEGKPGDLAVIFDQKRRFLAVGLYDPTSMIRVRVLQFMTPAEIDSAWFLDTIRQAVKIRLPLTQLPPERETNGYRVIFGENDKLPGLVLDRYAGTIVMKLYTPAWLPYLELLNSVMPQVLSYERLVLRLSRGMMKDPTLLFGLTDGEILQGDPLRAPVLFLENGITFEAEPIIGQKTGFFLDQRENRLRVEKISTGKSVLNVFSYTGGFSVYAGRGGASEVISVDLSEPAIAAAKRNWKHNLRFDSLRGSQHKGIVRDAFEVLAEMAAKRQRFDMVILDPPMFAHKQEQVKNALNAYDRLTRAGLAVLKPGGMLVQASCSSRVDAEAFFNGIHRSASSMGRSLIEIERSGHALDHPVRFSEGAYLKCLYAKAE